MRAGFQMLLSMNTAAITHPISPQRKNGLKPPSPHQGNSAAIARVHTIRPTGPNDVGPDRHREVLGVCVGRPTKPPGSCSGSRGAYSVTGV